MNEFTSHQILPNALLNKDFSLNGKMQIEYFKGFLLESIYLSANDQQILPAVLQYFSEDLNNACLVFFNFADKFEDTKKTTTLQQIAIVCSSCCAVIQCYGYEIIDQLKQFLINQKISFINGYNRTDVLQSLGIRLNMPSLMKSAKYLVQNTQDLRSRLKSMPEYNDILLEDITKIEIIHTVKDFISVAFEAVLSFYAVYQRSSTFTMDLSSLAIDPKAQVQQPPESDDYDLYQAYVDEVSTNKPQLNPDNISLEVAQPIFDSRFWGAFEKVLNKMDNDFLFSDTDNDSICMKCKIRYHHPVDLAEHIWNQHQNDN